MTTNEDWILYSRPDETYWEYVERLETTTRMASEQYNQYASLLQAAAQHQQMGSGLGGGVLGGLGGIFGGIFGSPLR